MHFRSRNNVIQVIRTTYDETTKKSQNTILGRMKKSEPIVDEQLQEACTSAEIQEIENWISHTHRVSSLKSEHAANTLREQMALANEWFSSNHNSKDAELLATEIHYEWQKLRKIFKKSGFIE